MLDRINQRKLDTQYIVKLQQHLSLKYGADSVEVIVAVNEFTAKAKQHVKSSKFDVVCEGLLDEYLQN